MARWKFLFLSHEEGKYCYRVRPQAVRIQILTVTGGYDSRNTKGRELALFFTKTQTKARARVRGPSTAQLGDTRERQRGTRPQATSAATPDNAAALQNFVKKTAQNMQLYGGQDGCTGSHVEMGKGKRKRPKASRAPLEGSQGRVWLDTLLQTLQGAGDGGASSSAWRTG